MGTRAAIHGTRISSVSPPARTVRSCKARGTATRSTGPWSPRPRWGRRAVVRTPATRPRSRQEGSAVQGNPWTPGIFVPYPRSVGGIVAQVWISEQERDELHITEHPVEQGAPISDHAYK